MADITTKYKSKWTGKEIDDGIEKARSAVPLDGSKAMTGNFKITKNQPLVTLVDTSMGREGRLYHGTEILYLMNDVDTTHYSALMLGKETASMDKLLRVQQKTDAGTNIFTVLHTGNKPSGSYTGNGSATSRTIAIGGVGEVMVVYGSGNMALVTPTGVIGKNSSGTVFTLAHGEFKFDNGVLTIATTNSALNNNGTTYYYQVL